MKNKEIKNKVHSEKFGGAQRLRISHFLNSCFCKTTREAGTPRLQPSGTGSETSSGWNCFSEKPCFYSNRTISSCSHHRYTGSDSVAAISGSGCSGAFCTVYTFM